MATIILLYMFLVIAFCQPQEDLITDLDGLNWTTNYKQYSGYLKLDNNHTYFYWLSESQNDPKNDPLVLWVQGGPGCTGIGIGMFYETGALLFNDDSSFSNNTYSWNLNANMLYMDSPICTGFSYNSSFDNNCTMNVDMNADDNYHAVLKFFDKFPIYINNSFYIIGESLGGTMIPVTTLRIINGNINEKNNTMINFKAFAIGNGRLNIELNSNSLLWFEYFHGLISEKLWNNLLTNCCEKEPYIRQNCNFMLSDDVKCREYVSRARVVSQMGTVNPYDLYGDCYHNDGFTDRDIVTCTNSKGADIYFNKINVRKQIHALQNVSSYKWLICTLDNANKTALTYHIEEKYHDMSNVIHKIFEIDPNIYGLLYWGDTDMNQNFLGGQWFVNDLGYNATSERREWYYEIGNNSDNKQVAGWTRDFQRFSLVTVRGSGHMVPGLRPVQALKMFQYFLKHQPL